MIQTMKDPRIYALYWNPEKGWHDPKAWVIYNGERVQEYLLSNPLDQLFLTSLEKLHHKGSYESLIEAQCRAKELYTMDQRSKTE